MLGSLFDRIFNRPTRGSAESNDKSLPVRSAGDVTNTNVLVARVFQPGTYPENTFIQRNIPEVHLLRTYLESGGKIICVSGPSKIGKTVLCRSLLKNSDFVRIPGSRISSYHEFVGAVADALNVASETIRRHEKSDQQLKGGTDEGQVGIKTPFASGDFSTSSNRQDTSQTNSSTEEVIRGSLESRLFRELEERRVCLMIDDFHRIPPEAQAQIISSCKDYLVAGEFRLLLVAIPSQMFETMRGKSEMVGRIQHIKIPAWQTSELEEIADTGFKLIGWRVEKIIARRLAVYAYGNPLLLQEMCQTFVNEVNIHNKGEPSKVTAEVVMKRLVEHYAWMGDAFEASEAEEKWALSSSRSSSNKKATTAQLALLAASEFPWNHVLSIRDTVIPKMKELSGTTEEIKPVHVINALRAVSNRLTPDTESSPNFELESTSYSPVKLIFREPHFRFYLQWGLRQQFKMRARSELIAATEDDESSRTN